VFGSIRCAKRTHRIDALLNGLQPEPAREVAHLDMRADLVQDRAECRRISALLGPAILAAGTQGGGARAETGGSTYITRTLRVPADAGRDVRAAARARGTTFIKFALARDPLSALGAVLGGVN